MDTAIMAKRRSMTNEIRFVEMSGMGNAPSAGTPRHQTSIEHVHLHTYTEGVSVRFRITKRKLRNNWNGLAEKGIPELAVL